MPGQPVALTRVSGCPPGDPLSRITAATGSAAIIWQVRNSHVSLDPLLSRLLCLAIQKEDLLVQKLWTMRVPCGRPRKTEDEL